MCDSDERDECAYKCAVAMGNINMNVYIAKCVTVMGEVSVLINCNSDWNINV